MPTIRVLVALLALVVASCGVTDDPTTTIPAGNSNVPATEQSAPTSLPEATTAPVADGGNPLGVLGEVSTASEAFCAGLSTVLADAWSPDTVSDFFTGPIPYDQCVAEELSAIVEIPEDMALHDAFANGCTVALTATMDSSLSISPEADLEIAWGACSRQFWETEWDADDYRITIDGVCYMGYGPEAGVPGCRDKDGAYITTTTVAYTASDNLDEYLEFAESGPRVLALTRDAGLAADVAQYWCASGVDYGTGDFAVWLTDVEVEGAGRYGYAEAEYTDTVAFLPRLAEQAIDSLCPEIADEFQADIDTAQRGEALNSPRPDQFSMGEATYYWTGQLGVFADIYDDLGREHWIEPASAICEELDQGVDPEDRFLSIEAWLDAGAPILDEPLIDAANALHRAAIDGLCPRHSGYYWSIAETGAPW